MTAREAFERGRNRWGVLMLHGVDIHDWDALYLTQSAAGELVLNHCLVIAENTDLERVTALWHAPLPATVTVPQRNCRS